MASPRARCLPLMLPIVLCSQAAFCVEPRGVEEMVARDDLLWIREAAAEAWRRIYAARPENAHRLPLPPAAAAPKIDGKLDDACWRTATSVVESARRLGLSAPKPAMRCRYCADEANLYLALDMTTRRSGRGNSVIEIQVGRRPFGPEALDGRGTVEFTDRQMRCRAPAQRAWGPWQPLCRFSPGAAGGCLEAAVPMSRMFPGKDWRKQGVRVLFRFGRLAGSPLAENRWIELFDSDTALVVEHVDRSADGRGVFRLKLLGPAGRRATRHAEVRLLREKDPKNPRQLAIGRLDAGRAAGPIEIPYCLPAAGGPGLVQLALTGEGWQSRHSVHVNVPRIAPLLKAIDGLLARGDGGQRFRNGGLRRPHSAPHSRRPVPARRARRAEWRPGGASIRLRGASSATSSCRGSRPTSMRSSS